jgi:hypothetical protein
MDSVEANVGNWKLGSLSETLFSIRDRQWLPFSGTLERVPSRTTKILARTFSTPQSMEPFVFCALSLNQMDSPVS